MLSARPWLPVRQVAKPPVLRHKEVDALMVIKAFIIAGNGCESEPLHDSEVDGITGQDTTGLHFLTHLVDVSGCDRFQSDQITQRCSKRVDLLHESSDDVGMVPQILTAVADNAVGARATNSWSKTKTTSSRVNVAVKSWIGRAGSTARRKKGAQAT